MKKITLKIDGMMCGMCESHVNDAIRKALAVKKGVLFPQKRGNGDPDGNHPLQRRASSYYRRHRLSAFGHKKRDL